MRCVRVFLSQFTYNSLSTSKIIPNFLLLVLLEQFAY